MNAVAVRMVGSCRITLFDAGELALAERMGVVVEAEGGGEFAEVVNAAASIPNRDRMRSGLRRVLRVMTEEDGQRLREKLVRERAARDFCDQRCETLKIPLKLIRIQFSADMKKAVFIYTAAGRIDFRQLIKDLAHELKVRVEMRQIGVRDEAKIMGGCGTCGYGLCCSTFLPAFIPVSIKMAKGQGLVLNPSKILGVCGRLKCCLAYEHHEGDNERAKAICVYDDDTV
jgi:cell fate regulator YaaT (PSP1 superfamily)